MPSTFYLDLEGGSDAADGTTFANRWKTFTNGPTAARIAAGDTIRMMAARRSSLGTCSWTKNSNTVTIPSGLTVQITNCDSAWTASASVTCSTTTSWGYKEGSSATAFSLATGFTTGKIAYKDLGSNQDYSAYEQISFWFMTTGTEAAGVYQIKLCSDATGDTPVNTFTLNFANEVGYMNPRRCTIDNGAALGSAIRSIAIYALSDPGGVAVVVDNIVACKAKSASDCITLTHIVKKAGTTNWYYVRSLVGTTMTLETLNAGNGVTNGYGYAGTTESAGCVALECVGIAGNTSQILNEPGTDGNRITFAGGYNRTDMSTIDDADDFTVIGHQREVYAYLFGGATTASYTTFSKSVFVNASGGVFYEPTGGADLVLDNCHFCLSGGVVVASAKFTSCTMTSNPGQFKFPNWLYDSDLRCESIPPNSTYAPMIQSTGNLDLTIIGSAVTGCNLDGGRAHFKNLVVKDCAVGITINALTGQTRVATAIVEAGTIECTTGYSGGSPNYYAGGLVANNFELVCTTETTEMSPGWNNRVAVTNFEAAGVHKIFLYGGVIDSDTSVRHTPSGISWKLQPTSTIANSFNPIELLLGEVLCVADEEITISAWFYRTNAGVSGQLCVYAKSLAGITNNVTDSMSLTAEWEQLSITFTPTQTGVVEVWALAWGGTTYAVYVDDLTQAVTP